jgi:hypothetical protein
MTSNGDNDFLAKRVTITPDGFIFVLDRRSVVGFWLQFAFWSAMGVACLFGAIALPFLEGEIGSDAAGVILKFFISLLIAFTGLLVLVIPWEMLTVKNFLAIEWDSTSKLIRYRCILRMHEEYDYVFKYRDWLGLVVEDGEGVDSHPFLWMAIRIGGAVKTSGPLASGDQAADWREFQLPAQAFDLGRLWAQLVHRRPRNYVRFPIGSFDTRRQQEHVIALIAKAGLPHGPPA